MSAKTAIRDYLAAGHSTFTTAEVSAATGIPAKTLSSAAFHMFRSGELVIENRTWRTVTYRAGTDFDREDRNIIFDECRQNWQGYRIHKIFGSARV